MTLLFRCCFVPIIIKFVLSGLRFSLHASIQNKMSVRQSLKVEKHSCAFDGDSICKPACHQHTGDD